VINELDKIASSNGVQGFIVPAHVYMCDYMTIKYSTQAIINVLRSQISKIPKHKREYKHFTPLYWYKVVDNMLGNGTATREVSGTVYGEMVDYNAFNHIVGMFLVSDYSVQDSVYINNLVNTASLSDIINACNTAKQNGVHTIAYMRAIIDGENGKREAERQRAEQMNMKIAASSGRLMHNDIHRHTAIELAEIQYNYEKKRESSDLEAAIRKLLGSMGG